MTMERESKTACAVDASARIGHLSRVLKALNKFREFASTEKSTPRCLKSACTILTEEHAYAGVWIISLGLNSRFEKDYHAGHSNLVDSLIRQFHENSLPSTYSKRLKEGNVVITDGLSATCPDDALSRYGSEMSAITCYLNHYNETFGIISVTLPRNLAHDEFEIELFKSVAEEITRQLCKQLQHLTCIRHGAKVRFESTLLGSVHQAVAATDLEGRILYWNGPAETLFGWHELEVLGERLIDLLSFTPSHEKVDDLIEKIKKGWRWSGEALLKRRNGSSFPALVSTSPVYNDNGETIGNVAIAIDLLPYKQAESKFLESEARFQTVFERSPVGIVLIGPDMRFTKANQAFCDITGYCENVLKGKSVKDITHPDDLEKDLGFKNQLFSSELPSYRTVKRIVRKDGGIAWVLLVSSAIKDASQKPLYLVSQVIDISELKKTEEALRKSEAEFRELFERMTSAVMIFGVAENPEDFVFKDINAAGERLVKNSKPNILGKQILKAFPRAEKIGLLSALREVNRTGEPKSLPLSHYKDQRLSQWLETNLYKLPSGEIVAVCDDRTDERELEGRLLQSQKMDAVGQLAGGIAHDFNNQLTGILGYAEMLKPRLKDQKQLHYLSEIIESGKRSSDLIRQLLAFSRKGQYQFIPVDLHKTIGDVVSLLQCSIDKRIQIKLKLNASHPVTKGDPSQLHNAILNLAINARDAMPQGGEIVFETDTVEVDENTCRERHYAIASGKYLKVSVIDTGIGMGTETLNHIFEPFFTTKPIGRGTGMGLPAVYGTIKKLNGAIDVISEPGHGTTFSLLLPLSAEAMPGRDSDRLVLPPTSTHHVLIAEDEDHIRRLVAEFLEGLNYKITLCRNGKDAIETYRELWPTIDVVILDIIMPEMNGSDTFIEMRKVNPNVKALIFSGYSVGDDVQKLLKDSAIDFLQKPFAMDDLSGKIRMLLQKKSYADSN